MTRKSPTIGGRHKADSTPSEYIRSLIRDDQDLAGNSEVALLSRRAVNQKRREFVAGSYGSADMAKFESSLLRG